MEKYISVSDELYSLKLVQQSCNWLPLAMPGGMNQYVLHFLLYNTFSMSVVCVCEVAAYSLLPLLLKCLICLLVIWSILHIMAWYKSMQDMRHDRNQCNFCRQINCLMYVKKSALLSTISCHTCKPQLMTF